MGKSKKYTQADRVLNYILENGSITSLDAIYDLGNTRLSASIFILKEMGYAIEGKFEPVLNRFGETCSVKRYYLKKEDDKND